MKVRLVTQSSSVNETAYNQFKDDV